MCGVSRYGAGRDIVLRWTSHFSGCIYVCRKTRSELTLPCARVNGQVRAALRLAPVPGNLRLEPVPPDLCAKGGDRKDPQGAPVPLLLVPRIPTRHLSPGSPAPAAAAHCPALCRPGESDQVRPSTVRSETANRWLGLQVGCLCHGRRNVSQPALDSRLGNVAPRSQ